MAYKPPHGTVDYQVKNGIAHVMLNRPKALNALNGEMQQDLGGVWPEINQDDNVRVAIVSGHGPAFSGITEETALQELPDGNQEVGAALLDWVGSYAHKEHPALTKSGQGPVFDQQGLHQLGLPDRTRGRPAKPLIAAVNGVCSGTGLNLVLFADIVLCSDDALFFDPRVNLSEAPLVETLGLVQLGALPRNVALRMAYMGQRYRIDAQRAWQMGLVTEVVPKNRLLARATEIAELIKGASPAAISAVVAAYWDTVSLPTVEARFVAQLFGQQARTIDGKEGHLAWVEKRAPNWPSLTSWSPPWPAVRVHFDDGR